jgi:hypothetical protein
MPKPKIADGMLSSHAMMPTSGDIRNSDLGPIVSIFYDDGMRPKFADRDS